MKLIWTFDDYLTGLPGAKDISECPRIRETDEGWALFDGEGNRVMNNWAETTGSVRFYTDHFFRRKTVTPEEMWQAFYFGAKDRDYCAEVERHTEKRNKRIVEVADRRFLGIVDGCAALPLELSLWRDRLLSEGSPALSPQRGNPLVLLT